MWFKQPARNFWCMPAMVGVDGEGMVRLAHYRHSMSDIPDNADVLATLGGL